MFGAGWQQFLVVLRFKALGVHVVRDGSKKFRVSLKEWSVLKVADLSCTV